MVDGGSVVIQRWDVSVSFEFPRSFKQEASGRELGVELMRLWQVRGHAYDAGRRQQAEQRFGRFGE